MELDFETNYVLENDVVKLVPLQKEHYAALLNISEEKNLWTYFLGPSNGLNRFEDYIDEAITNRIDKLEYPFAVLDKANNEYAGCTRFFSYSKDLKGIRLGYTWYGKNFRGTGINKNCKYLMMQFAFEQLLVERIGLGAHAENKLSIAAMKSIGCVHEGSVRNLFPSIHYQGRADAELFGILSNEWHSSIKGNLKDKL
tara:strand:+ start:27357 stop:27950 length:594 start_codon:yes stop_codon:yes gene_type:complete